MTEQPEALRLADELHDWGVTYASNFGMQRMLTGAAAELRRLHEENSKLRREVAAISANAVDDGRAISKLEAQLGEAVWNYGEVKRINAQLLEALELADRHCPVNSEAEILVRAAIAAAKLQERS
jgi:hypothetical protein